METTQKTNIVKRHRMVQVDAVGKASSTPNKIRIFPGPNTSMMQQKHTANKDAVPEENRDALKTRVDGRI